MHCNVYVRCLLSVGDTLHTNAQNWGPTLRSMSLRPSFKSNSPFYLKLSHAYSLINHLTREKNYIYIYIYIYIRRTFEKNIILQIGSKNKYINKNDAIIWFNRNFDLKQVVTFMLQWITGFVKLTRNLKNMWKWNICSPSSSKRRSWPIFC